MLKSLNQLRAIRQLLVGTRRWWLHHVRGVQIDPTSTISLSSGFRSGLRGGIVIGPESLVAFKTLLFTYDHASGTDKPIRVGRRCFIGGGSTIAPGVTVGDESIVGGGSVVLEDVPPRCIVGGNPARVLRTGIDVGRFGRLAGADENTRRLWKLD